MQDNIMEKPYGEIGLIVMNNIKELGAKVDAELKRLNGEEDPFFSYIIDTTQTRFSNGEGKFTINETVRGKDIYILADVGNYGETYKMFGFENHLGPDEHFQDIKRCISAINGKAHRINVVMPLMYSSRQHRRKTRESLDCSMALQELQSMGVQAIYSFDVHDPNVQNSIPLLSFENIYPTAEIVDCFLKNEKDAHKMLAEKNMIIISPDTGAMDRAIYYSNVLKQDIGIFYKRRDYTKVEDGKNPIIEHKYIGRDVEGKDILIVDDMIASGGSVLDIARDLKARHANKIYCASSFALFTEGPELFDQYYKEGFIERVYSTNLTYVPKDIVERDWFCLVDLSDLLSLFIQHVNLDSSVSGILDKTRGIESIVKG